MHACTEKHLHDMHAYERLQAMAPDILAQRDDPTVRAAQAVCVRVRRKMAENGRTHTVAWCRSYLGDISI